GCEDQAPARLKQLLEESGRPCWFLRPSDCPVAELGCSAKRESAMPERRITQIPLSGNSGDTPTGAMQFRDDWPGLFVRGDDAIMLMSAIQQLAERLANHPDAVVESSLIQLSRFADIIERDVTVRETTP